MASIKNVGMGKACIPSPIRTSSWACGKMINLITTASTSTATERSTTASFPKAKKMVEGSTTIKVEPCMMANGTKIEKMDSEPTSTSIAKDTKATG